MGRGCGGVAAGEVAWACRSIAPAACRAEPTLPCPGHPEIFVVGDICALQQDGQPLPGVAQVAKQEGAHAARNIVRTIQGRAARRRSAIATTATMATSAADAAVADIGPIEASGFFAWLLWLFLHIFWLIGFRNRLAVIGEWAWAYLTFSGACG